MVFSSAGQQQAIPSSSQHTEQQGMGVSGVLMLCCLVTPSAFSDTLCPREVLLSTCATLCGYRQLNSLSDCQQYDYPLLL